MKKLHLHHTKKKSSKNHSSKAKVRKFSVLTEETVKLHTHTKAARSRKKVENLKLAISKLSDKKIYTKADIYDFLTCNHGQIPNHQIKLILTKIALLGENKIAQYGQQGVSLPDFIKKIISDEK